MYSNKMFALVSLLAIAGVIAGAALVLDQTTEPVVTIPPVHYDTSAFPVMTDEGQQSTTASAQGIVSTTSETKLNGYTLLLSGDTLYVYRIGEVEPDESHLISAHWLPEYDRILLQNGLYVATTAELRQLLEDYTS